MNASKIAEHLWIGGNLPSKDTAGFDRLILAAAEHQHEATLFPVDLHVLRAPLTEELSSYEGGLAVQAGNAVFGWMKRRKNVLVTCCEGFDRSCLIGAIALMAGGWTKGEALMRVRAARGSMALSNPHLLYLLENLEGVFTGHAFARTA